MSTETEQELHTVCLQVKIPSTAGVSNILASILKERKFNVLKLSWPL